MLLLVLLSLVVALAALGLTLARERAARRTTGGDADALPEDVLGLRQEVAALRAETTGSLRHLAVVRFDAFGDVGGHLSWSLVLADASGSGVVLTSITGRSEARSYAKPIAGWASEQPLSPEEAEALEQARG